MTMKRHRNCLLPFTCILAGLAAIPAAAQDGITSLSFTDANGNPVNQGTTANLHISTNNVSNYSLLIGPDPSNAGGYYGSSCYVSVNVTFDGSGNAVAIVALLDQYGNYSDVSQRGQLSATGAVQYNSFPSNNQCSINLANSTVNGGSFTSNGYNQRYFNLSLNLTFQPVLYGVQGLYENYSSYSSTYGAYSTYGLIWSGQNFTVGSAQGPTITVTPSSQTVFQGRSQQFIGQVSGQSGVSLVWSINPAVGSISSNGFYTAPQSVSGDQFISVSAAIQGTQYAGAA